MPLVSFLTSTSIVSALERQAHFSQACNCLTFQHLRRTFGDDDDGVDVESNNHFSYCKKIGELKKNRTKKPS